VVAGLRRWAQGALTDEAAVELLVSSAGGRFARPGCAWIRPCVAPDWYWLDSDALTAHAERLAGSERRVRGYQMVCVNTSREVSTDGGCCGRAEWGVGGAAAGV